MSSICLGLTLALLESTALAQAGFGGGPPVGGPRGDDKPAEGPAEQAPDQGVKKGTIPPPDTYPGQEKKKVQFLQVGGYMRVRTDFFHNFNLDLPASTSAAPAFPLSVECNRPGGAPDFSPCQDNLSSANMRLRLEPIMNVSEDVRVLAQIDFLDNLVLGSTPEGYFVGTNGTPSAVNTPSRPPNVPLNAFSRGQVSPQGGRNSLENSVQVKRAWAEVKTPFGLARFGRMPSHWGTGMLVNDGGCPDCNFGSNADRIMFATRPGGATSPFVVFGAFDWAATGPTSSILDSGINQYGGQAYDATNRDDVSQYILGAGRLVKPDEFDAEVRTRGSASSYGLYFVYRTQEDDIVNVPLGTNVADAAGDGRLVNRDAWAVVPDLWFKYGVRKFRMELEVAGIGGKIGSTQELTNSGRSLKLLQLGAMGRIEARLYDNAFRFGLETGFASGDQAEPANGSINQRFGAIEVQPDGDFTVSRFRFDPDYQVDLIFWREIVGQVTNAIYIKPWLSYDFERGFWFKVDAIHSMAHVPVSTPGNSRHYGLETDFTIGYKNKDEGFFANFQYGFFIPMGALDHPDAIFKPGAPTGTAQVLKTALGIRF